MSGDNDGAGVKPTAISEAPNPVGAGNVENRSLQSPHPKNTTDAPQNGGDNGKKKPLSLISRLTVNEWLTLLVALGGLVVSIFTYRLASDTSDVEKAVTNLSTIATSSAGQLQEMQREQRPWISVKVVTDAPATLTRVGDNFEIRVKYRMENVGKTPANRVFFYAKLIPESDPSNFKGGIRDACDTFIKEMNEDVNSAGITIFPGQFAESNFGSDETPIADFATAPRPAMILAVCAGYRFEGDKGSFHFTPAAYIAGVYTKTPRIVVIDPNHIPAEGIRMQIAPLAQGNLGPT